MSLTSCAVAFRLHKKLGNSTHHSHMAFSVNPHVLDAVITSEYDILPILLKCARDEDLPSFLETVTLVCKMWLRVCRNIDSPDKRLRDALAQEDVHLASDLRIDCLWLPDTDNRDFTRKSVVKLSTYNQSPNSTKISVALLRKAIGSVLRQHDGWRGRELRRLHGYRIKEGSKTYSPPPSAIMKGNTAMAMLNASLACYGIPKCLLDKLVQWEEKYATRPEKKEKHAKLWNDAINLNNPVVLIRRPLSAINGVAILSGSNAMGAPVTTYYMVTLCYDYMSLGYQLVRLPALVARTIETDLRAWRDSLPGHPDWILWPCSPNNCAISPSMSGWEMLYHF